MPKGRNHAAACTDGDKMYVFGGREGYNDVLEGFADTQVPHLLLSVMCAVLSSAIGYGNHAK